MFSLSTLVYAIPFLSAGALRASIACLSRVEVVLGVISTVVDESPIHTMHGMHTLASQRLAGRRVATASAGLSP